MKVYNSDIGLLHEVDDEEEVTIEFRYGQHYSALWSLSITVDVWNGLPRIKRIETLDNWSDR